MSVSIPSLRSARIACLLAVILPVAVMQITRAFTALGPASANASSSSSMPLPVPAVVEDSSVLSPNQSRAMQWVTEHRDDEFANNPFARLRAEVSRPAPLPDPQDPAPSPNTPTPPDLKISGFMGKGDSAVVSINHRVRRVGDVVAPGWTIQGIDPANRTLRLTHEDGTSVSISANPRDK